MMPLDEQFSEDDVLSSAPSARVTPRQHSINAAVRSNLSTPLRRESSTGRESARRTNGQTPTTQSIPRALNRRTRPVPVRSGAPTTPHAIRALQQRRAAAALTPGQNRRRSGRLQRETPRDILRQLSRIEAPNSNAIKPSPTIVVDPRNAAEEGERDDLDDDIFDSKPVLSMPLEEDDEYSFQTPPRLSVGLDDITRSVERPRRELPAGHNATVETIRMSDRFLDVSGYTDSEDPTQSGIGDGHDYDIIGRMEQDEMPGDTEDLRELLEGNTNDVRGDTESLHAPFEYADASFAIDIPDEPSSLIPAMADANSPAANDMMHISEQDTEQPDFNSIEADGAHQVVRKTIRDGKTTASTSRKRSRHGIEYPALPTSMTKKMTNALLRSTSSRRSTASKDILKAVALASEWFFEQIGDDLGTFSAHAGKRTIDETDVMTLMRRQRILGLGVTPFSLAQKLLPRELVQDMRMPGSRLSKARKPHTQVP